VGDPNIVQIIPLCSNEMAHEHTHIGYTPSSLVARMLAVET